MIKACIFDLDGTLLNTIPTISYYCNLTLEHFGFEPIEEKKYNYFAGNGAKLLIERTLAHAGADLEKYFEKAFEYYNCEYNKNTTRGTKPFKGICELLDEMKRRGIKTFVLSNKPDFAAKSVIDSFLGDKIDATYGATQGVALKPSTEGLEKIMKEYSVSKSECLYIGDTDVDMQTGKNAGLFTIGVLWGFRDEEELMANGADLIVSNPVEISDYINEN